MAAGEALVVDDFAMIQQLLTRQLARKGWRCHSASTHTQAWEILKENQQISYVFLDFDVSDVERAPHFIQQLREERPDIQIVGISGHPRQDEFASSGVTRFLMKPWNFEDLDRVLK